MTPTGLISDSYDQRGYQVMCCAELRARPQTTSFLTLPAGRSHMIATVLAFFSLFYQTKMADPKKERTFIMVKPDGVKRGLIADIMKRFEQKGFKLVGAKLMQPSPELVEEHYIDLKSKPFYKGLCAFIATGPVFPMVWEGKGAVTTGRVMLGETDPAKSKPGSIRGDFCIDIGRNIIHGSDSVETAKKEIALWFNEKELTDWTPAGYDLVYEK